MTKAVFTTKVDPTYDDLPEERYHFPRTYLRVASAAVGDWIVYYEPRRTSGDLESRGGRQAYFATARLQRIEQDQARSDHFYAFVSDYLEFDRAVPFREGEITYELGLTKEDGSTNKGAFGRSVRSLSDAEYDLILQAGYAYTLGLRQWDRPGSLVPEDPQPAYPGFGDAGQTAYTPEIMERRIVEQLVARPFRDRAFAAAVKSAYDDTCAMTGLRIINGGGRSEVQAAHIRPVADHGPDSVRNGLALSGTVHWMFDRGLVSIDDDYTILVAKGRVPDTVERLLVADRKLKGPSRPDLRSAQLFLQYHRTTVFKG
jgi:putative restriction endonuclease